MVILLCVSIFDVFYIEHKNLGKGYEYYPWRREITGPVDIPSKIVEFSYDDSYIVATQKYKEGSPADMYDLGYYDGVPLSRFDHDGDGVVYWIVNKETHRNIVCGDRQEFMARCDSIGVSGNLTAAITY